MSLKPWKILSSSYAVQDNWITVRADVCETASGVRVDPYYVLETTDWAQVFALDERELVLVVRQYRHGAGIVTIELPSGRLDPGESAIEGAKRELREETGCEAPEWHALTVMRANPARQPTRAYGFLARGAAVVGETNLDPTEEIEIEFISIDKLLKFGRAGEMPAPHFACVLDALIEMRKL